MHAITCSVIWLVLTVFRYCHERGIRMSPDLPVFSAKVGLARLRRTRLWPFVLAAVGEHFFLSSCLLATRNQNKQWPTIIFAWSYSTYYNFTGCRWVILSERAAESRSNTFSHRHTPAWYTKMAAVTWPGDVDLRQLQWVYSIDVLQQAETENTQPADGQFNFIHF